MVKIEAARDAMIRFEEFRCVKTFDAMVVAVSRASGKSQKSVRALLERKYGRLHSREVI
jgi:hypothetical protein